VNSLRIKRLMFCSSSTASTVPRLILEPVLSLRGSVMYGTA
jgi:hypothetical protein